MDGLPSVVDYFAEHEGYRCGYCKSPDTNFSHGMWAHQLNVQDYQDLIDRGWRRSGKYCYKPTMNRTCCPMYPIKCDTAQFKLSKSQKKAIKRMNRYLITGKRDNRDDMTGQEDGMSGEGDVTNMEARMADKMKPSHVDGPIKAPESKGKQLSSQEVKSSSGSQCKEYQIASSSKSQRTQTKKNPPKPGSGPDPNRPICRKAKELRSERRQQKLAAKPDKGDMQSPTEKKNSSKSLEELLSEPDQASQPAHKLELRLIRSSPRSPEFESSFAATHGVYHAYQMGIHKDPPSKPTQSQFTRFLCDSPLGIRLCRSCPQSSLFQSSFQDTHWVFSCYQMAVHGEEPHECDEPSFTAFLVESPLEELHKAGGPSMGYGSFHQQYLLDGKIVAVGVLDILPTCVSSVYLYYDPAYSFLGLGVYSALREVAFVRELSRKTPALHNYYMGFYIHSCPKMRYKGLYSPSFLNCPETYNWIPIEKCRPKLEKNNYSRLTDDDELGDKDRVDDINQVVVLFKRTAMTYSIYTDMRKGKNRDQEEVMEYANYAGRKCAERMFLVRK